MDRGAVLLADLRAKLEEQRGRITNSTHAYAELRGLPAGEFVVQVTWPGGIYEKVFTRAFVFGASYLRAPPQWKVQRRACDYTRDIIAEVLQRRGV